MMDEIENEVKKAIQNMKKGSSSDFENLVSNLKREDLDSKLLCCYVNVLKKNVINITKDHEVLIGVLLKMNWIQLDPPIPDLFISFIIDLISSKSYYVKVCIKNIIRKFIIKEKPLCPENENQMKAQFEKLHGTLDSIMKIAPLSRQYISDIIKVNFPYIGRETFILKQYIINILQFTTKYPDLTCNMLALVVDKLLSIDVRISKDDFDTTVNNEDLQFETELEKQAPTNEMIDKLDQLMAVLYIYIHSLTHANGAILYNDSKILCNEILKIFEDVILKTQQSSHVQFLIFYITSIHKSFAEMFISKCWQVFDNPNTAHITRQASSAYLASFIARAKFIDIQTVKQQIKKISEWIHRYLDYQDVNSSTMDFYKHAPFHSICQTLFYIFIYHHKSLVETPENKLFLKSLNFMRIVTSKLNPLKYCLSTIVNLFARIARFHEIVFCYSIIERNNRNALNELSLNNVKVSHNTLGTYFPFDPYSLPRTRGYINPIYLEWTNTDLDENSDSDIDETDVDEEDDDILSEKDESYSSQPKSWKFNMMCISPGFHLT